MLIRWLRPLYSDDDGTPDGTPQGGDAALKPRTSDVLDRYGRDALKLAEKLAEALSDNYGLREKNRTLRADKAALEKSQTPAGAVVLSKEDAALWESYKALGAPDALKTSLEHARTATQEATALRRSETIRAAAEAHGWRKEALGKLPSLSGKDLTPRDVLEDGKTVRRFFVGELPLSDYIQANDPELMAALKDTTTPAPAGTGFVSQGGAGDQRPSDLAAQFIARQEAARAKQKNPLMRS